MSKNKITFLSTTQSCQSTTMSSEIISSTEFAINNVISTWKMFSPHTSAPSDQTSFHDQNTCQKTLMTSHHGHHVQYLYKQSYISDITSLSIPWILERFLSYRIIFRIIILLSLGHMHTDDIPIFCNWFSLHICKRQLFLTPNEYSVIALCQKNSQIFFCIAIKLTPIR